MIIQRYPDDLDYVNAQLKLKGEGDNSFLGTFCLACLRADAVNYELLRPVVRAMRHAYPADPRLLGQKTAERRLSSGEISLDPDED